VCFGLIYFTGVGLNDNIVVIMRPLLCSS
jgi:hypothetical protein